MTQKVRLGLTVLLSLALSGCSGAYVAESEGGIYLQDDFSDPASGWDRVSGADGVTDYADGQYRIFSAMSNYYLWATAGRRFPSDVHIEVDVIKKGGPDESLFGVLCRYQDVDNFYILMISGDGQAGIAKVQSGSGLTMLTGATLRPDAAVRTSPAANHLRADCVGDHLTLLINDTLVVEASDSSFSDGDVGLWLGSKDLPGADVYFDNFFVRTP